MGRIEANDGPPLKGCHLWTMDFSQKTFSFQVQHGKPFTTLAAVHPFIAAEL